MGLSLAILMAEQKIQFCLGKYHKVQSYRYMYPPPPPNPSIPPTPKPLQLSPSLFSSTFPGRIGFCVLPPVLLDSAQALEPSRTFYNLLAESKNRFYSGNYHKVQSYIYMYFPPPTPSIPPTPKPLQLSPSLFSSILNQAK